jgi:formate hydrogenlyase subunit 3/multisubunit Na+/H+ antiporter MnhD subunit
MEESQIYILISIIALLIIAIVLFFLRKNKKQKPISILGSFSLFFVLSGIIFGDNRLIGYSLIGIGVLLAVADIIVNKNKK